MRKHAFQGRSLTTNEISEITGICPSTIRSHVRKGNDLDVSLPAVRPHKTYTAWGRSAKVAEWAKAATIAAGRDVSPSELGKSFEYHTDRCGRPPEHAITTCIRKYDRGGT